MKKNLVSLAVMILVSSTQALSMRHWSKMGRYRHNISTTALKKLWKNGDFEKISKNYQKVVLDLAKHLDNEKLLSYFQYFNQHNTIALTGVSKKELKPRLYSSNQNFTVGFYNKEYNQQQLLLMDNNGDVVMNFGEYPHARHVEINKEGTKILVSDGKFAWDLLRIHLFLGKKETLKEELALLEEYEKWLQGEKHDKN